MTAIPFDQLVAPLTAEDALEAVKDIATDVELPVTTYVAGDVALSLLEVLAEWSAQNRVISRAAIAGGLLDFAENDFLTVLAKQVYGVDRISGTYATVPVLVTNTGSESEDIGANDVVVAHDDTDKTYTNVEPTGLPITLTPGQSTTLSFKADEIGADSSAAVGEITTVVSGQLDLTVTNTTPAVAFDDETDEQLRARCRLKVPAISKTAAGPAGKYAYIAITPEENGGAVVTRADVRGDNTDGSVDVVLAGPSGAVTGDDVDLVEASLVKWVIGPAETLSVVSATNYTYSLDYSVWAYDDINLDEAQLAELVAQRVALLFAVAPIGGWKRTVDANGKIFANLLEAIIKSVSERIFQVVVSGGDMNLTENQVPVLGDVDSAILLEAPPATGGTL